MKYTTLLTLFIFGCKTQPPQTDYEIKKDTQIVIVTAPLNYPQHTLTYNDTIIKNDTIYHK